MLKDIAAARVYYYRAGSAASALTPSDLDSAPIAKARAVLVTGVTALISESAQRTAVELLQRARGLRIVDPNLRVGFWGSDRAAELITPLIARADIVLGGELELRSLFGGHNRRRDAREHDPSRRDHGRRKTRTARRRRPARRRDDLRGIPPRQSVTVDAVGAGDAFNAGYIAATLDGCDPSTDAPHRCALRCSCRRAAWRHRWLARPQDRLRRRLTSGAPSTSLSDRGPVSTASAQPPTRS